MLGSLASPTGYAGGCLRASPFFMPAPIERPGAKQKTSRRTGGLCVLWGMVRCQHVRAQGLCGCVLSLAERFAIVKGENARVAQRHPAQRERKKNALFPRNGRAQGRQRNVTQRENALVDTLDVVAGQFGQGTGVVCCSAAQTLGMRSCASRLGAALPSCLRFGIVCGGSVRRAVLRGHRSV